jgi:hypothetical protein
LKAILQYLGDSWIGKAKHKVEGVIYHYVEGDDIERIKDVPSKLIRARIEGSWMSQLYYIFPGSSVRPDPSFDHLPSKDFGSSELPFRKSTF